MKRTDCHRVGAIVPSNYVYVLSFAAAGSNPLVDPAINFKFAVDYTRQAMKDGAAMFGNLGKCGVCGARFRMGDIWRHEPTGDVLCVGHECAEKYSLVADRADWEAQLEAMKRGRAARLEALLRDKRYADFLSCELGRELGVAFEVSEHPIIADFRQNVRKWGRLTPKQHELAIKLCSEANRPAYAPRGYGETKVPAPKGRQEFTGVVISVKDHEGFRGAPVLKITMKVDDGKGGTWMAWGTLPAALAEEGVKGRKVQLTATLEPSEKDPSFAFFKRPTNASLVDATV